MARTGCVSHRENCHGDRNINSSSSMYFPERFLFPSLFSSQVKYSPSANESPPRTLIDAACAHSVTLLRNCKDSIQENVTQAMSALGQAFSAVLSAFRPSGKEKGPSSVYGDL